MLYANLWGSIIVMCRGLISELNVENSDLQLQLFDWEAGSTAPELPDGNLLGPTSLTFTEYDKDIEVTFAVAASTVLEDSGLFMLRHIMGTVFERLRAEQRIAYFDAMTASEESVLVMESGTLLAPMTRPSTRAFQYVQGQALLVPS